MKFKAEQVGGIGASQFREAVNYADMASDEANKTHKANKGYVRFSESGGKVVLSKVNNKIDVWIGARINVNEANNRLIRRRFYESLEPDLKFLSEKARTKIYNTIGAGSKEVMNTPLSRREISLVFKTFDAEFNTRKGREKILELLLANGMESARDKGLDVCVNGACDIDKFCRDCFNGRNKADLMCAWNGLYQEVGDDADPADKLSDRRMQVSEMDFRGAIIGLEAIIEQNIKMKVAEKKRTDLLTGWANTCAKDTAGFNLGEDVRSAWIEALKPLADTCDVSALVANDKKGKSIVGQVDYRARLVELFVDQVLRSEFNAVLGDVKVVGAADDKDFCQEVIAERLSFGSVQKLAREFFAMATDKSFLKSLDRLQGNEQADDDEIREVRGKVNETVAKFLDAGSDARVQMDAHSDLQRNANLTNAEAGRLGASLAAAKGAFISEARLDWYVKKFIFDRYGETEGGSVGAAASSVCAGLIARAQQAIDQATVAGQLARGIRQTVFGSDGTVASVTSSDGGAGKFATRILGQLTDGKTLKELKCGLEEACAFASLAMPNVIAGVRDELLQLRQSDTSADNLYSDDHVKATVESLKKGYSILRGQLSKFGSETDRFMRDCEGVIKRHVAAKRFSDFQADKLRRKIQSALLAARDDATREIAMLAPIEKKLAERVVKDRVNGFKANARGLLANAIMENSFGFRQKEELEVDRNVAAAVRNWKEKNATESLVSDPLGLNLVTTEEIEARLREPMMADFRKILVARVKDKSLSIGEDTVKSVQAAFAAKVDGRIAAFRDAERRFIEHVEKYGVEVVVAMMEGDEQNARTPWTAYAALDRRAKRDLALQIVQAAMLNRRTELRQIVFDFVDHPETYTKGWFTDKMKDMAWDGVIMTQGFNEATLNVLKGKEAVYDRWQEKGGTRLLMESQVFELFAKDARAKGVSERDLRTLVSKNGDAFFERAETLKAHWAGQGREAFIGAATDALVNGLDDRVNDFAKYISRFNDAADEVDKEFSMLSHKNLFRSDLISEIARRPGGGNELEQDKDAYRKRLADELHAVIKRIKAGKMEYRDAYQVACSSVREYFDKCFKDKVALSVERVFVDVDGDEIVEAAGLDAVKDRALRFFYDAIDYAVAADPEKYVLLPSESNDDRAKLDNWLGSLFDKFESCFAGSLAKVSAGAVDVQTIKNASLTGIDPMKRIDELASRLGFDKYISAGNLITERLRETLNAFMRSDEYKPLHAKAVAAAVDSAMSALSGASVPVSADAAKALDEYDAAVKRTIGEFIATINDVNALNESSELAAAYLSLELDKRRVPDTKNAYGMTVRDNARVRFSRKLADEAAKMYAATLRNEAYESKLMTREFLDEMIAQIETECYSEFASRWVRENTEKLCDIIVKGENGDDGRREFYNYDGETDTPFGKLKREVVRRNRMLLSARINDYLLERIIGITTYQAFIDSDVISKLDTKVRQDIDRNIFDLVQAAQRRHSFAESFEHAVNSAVSSYEDIVLRYIFSTPVEAEPPFKSLDEFIGTANDVLIKRFPCKSKDASAKLDALKNGGEWEKARRIIRDFVGGFRSAAVNYVTGEDGILTNLNDVDAIIVEGTSVDAMRKFGNDYVEKFLFNDNWCSKEKDKIMKFARAIAKVLGIPKK